MASDGSAYGKGLAAILRSSCFDGGSKVEKQQTVQPQQKDYSALVSKIKSSGCTAVFYGGYSPEAGLIRKQMSAAGLNDVTMLGGDGIQDDDVHRDGRLRWRRDDRDVPVRQHHGLDGPGGAAVRHRFHGEVRHPTGIYAGEGWDIAQMYIAAFKAGKTTRQEITDFLHGLSGFKGLTK